MADSKFEDLLIGLNYESNKEKIKKLFIDLSDKMNNLNNKEKSNVLCLAFPVIRRIIDNKENIQIEEINVDDFLEKLFIFYKKMLKSIKDVNLYSDYGVDIEAEILRLFSELWVEKYKIQ
jgi:hypothetical protein